MRLQEAEITTPEHIKLRFPLAGLGSRGAAFLFDTIFLMIVYIVLLAVLLWLDNVTAIIDTLDLLSSATITVIIILNFLIVWGYFVLFEFFSKGRTLGKIVVGLRVIQENGQSLTFLTSCIRNFLRIIDFLPGFFFIGMLLIFLHPKHKRLGDLASGTIVVYERKHRKESPIEKVLSKHYGSLKPLALDEWSKRKFTSRDWQILKIYMERQVVKEKFSMNDLTEKVAKILLRKVGIEVHGRKLPEIKNDLISLYMALKDDFL